MTHAQSFYQCLRDVLYQGQASLKHDALVAEMLVLRKRGGRLFCLGVGGGAANAAHAACDFRKLCGIEAYAPTDGIAELTARTNDDGWSTVFSEWLRVSRIGSMDAIFVFSVGGGHVDVSACIHGAVAEALGVSARILGVVGRSDGAVAKCGHVVVVTGVEGPLLTPVTEAAQVAVLHALVSDPRLQQQTTKW